VTGQEALAARAGRKLRNDELLVTGFAATRLRLRLDHVPLWRGNHVAIKQFVEDFARYLYLPRLKEPAASLQAVRDGSGLLTWSQDSFAYADSFDEHAACAVAKSSTSRRATYRAGSRLSPFAARP
jgi:hypothetical protein